MGSKISSVLRLAAVGVLSLALSGCYGWWGYHHHPYGPGYGHPGPSPSYYH